MLKFHFAEAFGAWSHVYSSRRQFLICHLDNLTHWQCRTYIRLRPKAAIMEDIVSFRSQYLVGKKVVAMQVVAMRKSSSTHILFGTAASYWTTWSLVPQSVPVSSRRQILLSKLPTVTTNKCNSSRKWILQNSTAYTHDIVTNKFRTVSRT